MAGSARKRRRRPNSEYRPPGSKGHRPPERATAYKGDNQGRSAPRNAGTTAYRRRRAERPPAPWGSFPLVELVVLLAIILLVAGFIVQGVRGAVMIMAGLALGLVAGLELAIREHFAGYKSHTTVLAGAVAVLVVGVGFFALPRGWPSGAGLLVGALVFAVAFYLLREAFKRRSGGLGFR